MAVVDTRAGQLSWRTQAGSSATLTVVARDKDGAPVDLSTLIASITPRGGTAQEGAPSDVTLGTRRWSWPGTVTSLVEAAGSGRLSISDGDEWIVGTVWASLSGTSSQQLVASVTVGQAVVDLSAQIGGGGGGAVDSVNGATGVVVLTAADVGADPVGSAQAVADGLGTAAAEDVGAFATAAQGALADSAVQSIVAGTNVTVDATDQAHPVVSASGGGSEIWHQTILCPLGYARSGRDASGGVPYTPAVVADSGSLLGGLLRTSDSFCWIEWDVWLDAGTWSVTVTHLRNASGGVGGLLVAGVEVAEINFYDPSSVRNVATSAAFTGASSGKKVVRVAHKSGAANNMSLQSIQFRRTA